MRGAPVPSALSLLHSTRVETVGSVVLSDTPCCSIGSKRTRWVVVNLDQSSLVGLSYRVSMHASKSEDVALVTFRWLRVLIEARAYAKEEGNNRRH